MIPFCRDLTSNSITFIAEGVFANLTNLQRLYVKKLTSINFYGNECFYLLSVFFKVLANPPGPSVRGSF